jgi:phenylpropionate dioxygenase-like ring-hydroxylating dioxygenase large terminal subunit
MGTLLRRFWVPVLLSSEIPEPDSPQVRVKIMGERLLAFRDTKGRPGLVGEFCAHRGASLFFGRNEDCGIRCAYHGLKFDITGQCVDAPSAPEIAARIRIVGYPCIERGGIVWAYMGPPDHRPEPPELEWANLPSSQCFVSRRVQECNYLQAMEGGVDTAHVPWLHRFEFGVDPLHKHTEGSKYLTKEGKAVHEFEVTDSGYTIYARRDAGEDAYYWRIAQWIFPWFTLIPPYGNHPLGGHAWVPIDDQNCWTWNINFHPDRVLSADERQAMEEGLGIHAKYVPGSLRPLANKDNDYLIDRRAQRENRSFSGVQGFATQDAAMQESPGPIQDRLKEFLLPSDAAIVRVRRMLYDAMNALQQAETPPPGINGSAQRIRPASVVLKRSVDVRAWAKASLQASRETPVYAI